MSEVKSFRGNVGLFAAPIQAFRIGGRQADAKMGERIIIGPIQNFAMAVEPSYRRAIRQTNLERYDPPADRQFLIDQCQNCFKPLPSKRRNRHT